MYEYEYELYEYELYEYELYEYELPEAPWKFSMRTRLPEKRLSKMKVYSLAGDPSYMRAV